LWERMLKKTQIHNSSCQIRIAILGSRGIPAKYGGFETIAEELSVGLVERGFEVYVSCESKKLLLESSGEYKGVRLLNIPIIKSVRSFSEPFIYDLLSVLRSTPSVNVIYMLGHSSVLTLLIPRFLKKIVIVNVDGLESKRRKYNGFLSLVMLSFEKITPKIANYILADSEMIALYYRKNYNINPVFVPNGGGRIREYRPYEPEMLKLFNLKKGGYYLVVARLEDDNNIRLIVEAFKNSNSKLKLVVVGSLINTRYVEKLLELKDERILFVGGIYDPRMQRTLRFNCFAYIHGHEMGGTNPSLLEALSCGNKILALDVPFNKEVAEYSAVYFKKDTDDLTKKIEIIEGNNDQSIDKKYAREIFERKYSGDKPINALITFLKQITYRKSNSSTISV
jgi:glycosyltransferase involved in cell wall biosynthesis